LADVSITLFAVAVPVLLTVTVATVLAPLQDSVDETPMRGAPVQAVLQVVIELVIARLHPPEMFPVSVAASSTT
jgi:hypothetical protein